MAAPTVVEGLVEEVTNGGSHSGSGFSGGGHHGGSNSGGKFSGGGHHNGSNSGGGFRSIHTGIFYCDQNGVLSETPYTFGSEVLGEAQIETEENVETVDETGSENEELDEENIDEDEIKTKIPKVKKKKAATNAQFKKYGPKGLAVKQRTPTKGPIYFQSS